MRSGERQFAYAAGSRAAVFLRPEYDSADARDIGEAWLGDPPVASQRRPGADRRANDQRLEDVEKSIAASEPVRERLLAAFRPAEIHIVLDILGRIAEAMDFPYLMGQTLNAPPDKIKTRRHKPANRNR